MEIRCNTHVETIKQHGDGFELGVRGEDKADIRCDYLIAAPGRAVRNGLPNSAADWDCPLLTIRST